MEHCLVSNWLLGYKWIAWNLERLILLWLWSHELCKNPTAWQGCWQVSFKLKWPEEKVPQVQTHTAWCRLWRITKCQPCQPLSDSSDWTLHASLGCFSKLTMTDRLTVQRFILHGKDTWWVRNPEDEFLQITWNKLSLHSGVHCGEYKHCKNNYFNSCTFLVTKRQHFSISLLYLWTSPLQTILMIRAGTLRSREDERVKKGEEGYGEVRAVANCAKGQWGMPSKVGGRKWRQHMGGVAARQGWCKNMVTGSDWKKPVRNL